jgi:uncharacterized phage protein (TIGR02216 family)
VSAAGWPELIGLACGVMRMSPADFWAMSPREFDAAARPFIAPQSEAPARRALDALMRQFPDA